jgi:hypothetical protein
VQKLESLAMEEATAESSREEAEAESAKQAEKATASDIPSRKATTALFSPADIQRFVDFGLGRGVDSTDPHPWTNKTSFQVRNPNATGLDDILIGTDEGGMLQKFRHHITSKKSVQLQLKAAVSIPNTPVSLGIEGELSRGIKTSKEVRGRRVTNTEIAFRMGALLAAELPTGKERSPKLPPNFEEIFSRFLWKQICRRSKDRRPEEVIEKSATSLLTEYLQSSTKEENALIVEDCKVFILYFGVTHYVSSMTLGASELTIITNSKRSTTASQGFNISVPMIASTKEKFSLKYIFSKTSSAKQRLGKIVDGKVEKGSDDEAVIKVKILPIYSLIHHNPFIFLALHKAIADYAEERTASLQPGTKFVQVITCLVKGIFCEEA